MANAIRELTKCVSDPSPAAYKEMLRVIKFTVDTADYGLKIHPTHISEGMEWKLLLYLDSDWAGDKDDRKSISGHILYVNGVPVTWSSRGQKTVALSSGGRVHCSIRSSKGSTICCTDVGFYADTS